MAVQKNEDRRPDIITLAMKLLQQHPHNCEHEHTRAARSRRKLLNIQQGQDDDEDVIHSGNTTTSIFHATN
jgi:hypothetical protein